MPFIRPSKQHGFTLVEVLVVMPIVILAVGAFVTVMVTMTGEVLKTQAQNAMVYNTQAALNMIEQDVKLSGAFLAGNELPAPAPQGYGGGAASVNEFTNVGSKGTMLILRTFTTDRNPLDPSRQPVYTNQPTFSCDATVKTTNQLFTSNTIYFTKSEPNGTKTLWRRTLIQQGYGTPDLCDNVWQQPSCSPAVSKNATCTVDDIRVLDNIEEFEIEYFHQASDATPIAGATSTANSVAIRNDLLSTADTIHVTLAASDTIAGRTVDHTAVLRATKLNVESQPPTIVTLEAATQPVSQTALVSETVSFTAKPNLNDASIQWQRRLDGATSWSNISGANDPTYTIDSLQLGWDGYSYRAVFQAGSDTVISDVATLGVDLWGDLQLQNSWVNYGGSYSNVGFTRTNTGVVLLKGLIKRTGGTPSTDEVIGQLPEGYRPADRLMYQTIGTGNNFTRIDIREDGTIRYEDGGADGFFSLEGVAFVPASAPYDPVNPALRNGWVNFGASSYGGNYGQGSYIIDGAGRVHTRGLLQNGDNTYNTVMMDLPAEAQPDAYLHIPAKNGSGFGVIGIDSQGVRKRDVGGTFYQGINAMYYPGTYSGWQSLNLLSGWQSYGGIYVTPAYTKAADGIVTLKGLIEGGATSGVVTIGTLPPGYRPASTTVSTVVSANTQARIDIRPNGDIELRGGNSGWVSLSSVKFMAEQ